MQAATLTAVVVFPTPPFWLAMAYRVAMSGADASGRGGGPRGAARTRPSGPEPPWNGIRRNAPAAFPPGPSRRRQLARVVGGSVGGTAGDATARGLRHRALDGCSPEADTGAHGATKARARLVFGGVIPAGA